MKILILEHDRFMVESKDAPVLGNRYILEDAINGTQAQNKTLHALIQCLYKWMLSINTFQFEIDSIYYDFRCPDYLILKDVFKMRYGAGADHYEYVNDNLEIINVKKLEDIPLTVVTDFTSGNKKRVKKILKSWSKYTKKQRTDLIETTLCIMKLIGVDSKKFAEILEGMEE